MMPKVPANSVADPFNNYVKGKDQSRVPQSGMHPSTMPSQTEMFMAAAIMDAHGLLFDPSPMAPGVKFLIERERDRTEEKPIPSKPVEPDRTGPAPFRTKVAAQ